MSNKVEQDYECEYCHSKALVFSYIKRTMSIVEIECLMCGHCIAFQEVSSRCNHGSERYKRVVMYGYFLNSLHDIIEIYRCEKRGWRNEESYIKAIKKSKKVIRKQEVKKEND